MLTFVVDDRISVELRREILKVCNEAESVFRTITIYDPLPGNYISDEADIIKETEYGSQREAVQILRSVRRHLGTSGRRYVVITSCDITSECDTRESGYLNFVFGLKHGGDVIISTARFMGLEFDELKDVLTGLIMHEIGHLYGAAADPERNRTEENLGSHCTDPYCVMQQGNTLSAMREKQLRAIRAPGWHLTRRRYYFCRLCSKDIGWTLRHLR